MSIRKISSGLGTTTKIELLNDMILELYGLVQSGKFDINEIAYLYEQLMSDRKYARNISIGHLLSDYSNWTHVKAESGYSIWKIAPTNYEYNSENQLYFNDKVFENMGLATSELGTFSKVFEFDGSSYVDNTTEAGTEEGTEFSLMEATDDFLYVGSSSKFNGVKFEFQTPGVGYSLKVEYWNGSAWTELTVSDLLSDTTDDFATDGLISWTSPSAWATNTVNSSTLYWIRLSTNTAITAIAEAYYIVPGNTVEGLLALSSTEYFEEDYKWCSYGSYVYVTIPNTGNINYEGTKWISSSSSATNKQNFFIYNNEYTMDYEDLSYVGSPLMITVIDKDLSVPPTTGVAEGDKYVVASGATGAWSGHDNDIAEWDGDSWSFVEPSEKFILLTMDSHIIYLWDDSAWTATSAGTGDAESIFGFDIEVPGTGDDGKALTWDADTNTWILSTFGLGDMLKSTYDTDNDGRVDVAEGINDGTYTATASDLSDAVSKKHTAGTETVGGDLSGTTGSATVNKIKGKTVPTPASADDGKMLSWDADTDSWVLVSTGAGIGDMEKSVYDTDNDGRVDVAEGINDGTYTATASDLSDAVSKKHTQNTDKTLIDSDSDTKIQVEETSDDDKIRFDVAGLERMLLESSGLTVKTGDNSGVNVFSAEADIYIDFTKYSTGLVEGYLKYNFANDLFDIYTNSTKRVSIGGSDVLDVTGNIKLSGNITDGTNVSSPATIKGAIDISHTAGTETVGGDLSGTTGSATVNKIKGKTVPTPASADDEKALAWDADTDSWILKEISGDMLKSTYDTDNDGRVDVAEGINDGTYTATASDLSDAVSKKHTAGTETVGGDLSGTTGSATVNKIKGKSVATPSTADDSKYLQYDADTDSFVLTNAGIGDMEKSVYDTDNDGRVDVAEGINDGTYTATASDISDAVSKKHSQNTDTGTSATTFTLGIGADDSFNIVCDNGTLLKPQFLYQKSNNTWYFCSENSDWHSIGWHGQEIETSSNDFSIGDGTQGYKTLTFDMGTGLQNKIRWNNGEGKFDISIDGGSTYKDLVYLTTPASADDGKALTWDADTNTWILSTFGLGDMLKSTYDTDNDGKVETADLADVATTANGLRGKTVPTPASADDGKMLSWDADTDSWVLSEAGSGAGDMLKSTYDTDNDGVVDKSEGLVDKSTGEVIAYYDSEVVDNLVMGVAIGWYDGEMSEYASICGSSNGLDVNGGINIYHHLTTQDGATITLTSVDNIKTIQLGVNLTTSEFEIQSGETNTGIKLIGEDGYLMDDTNTVNISDIALAIADTNKIKGKTVATPSTADDSKYLQYDADTDSFVLSSVTSGSSITRGTFTNSNLSSGVLTITHNKGLSAPYSVMVSIFDNNYKQIIPDEITGATNSVAIDLSSFGTISGTWGYAIIS